jgi:hypothetical protein
MKFKIDLPAMGKCLERHDTWNLRVSGRLTVLGKASSNLSTTIIVEVGEEAFLYAGNVFVKKFEG